MLKLFGRVVVVLGCAGWGSACGTDAPSSTEAVDTRGAGGLASGGAGAAGAAAGSPAAVSGGAGAPAVAGTRATSSSDAGAGGADGAAGSAGAKVRDGVAGSGAGHGAAGAAAPSAGTAAPAAMGCTGGDPLELLRSFAPTDPDLAKDFASYLSKELGSLTCATEGRGGARTIQNTIFVPPGAVYDGKGEHLTADVAAMRCDTTEGEQAEDQRPYFLLAPGAGLKNVTITYPGCEGVHMMGDNRLDNVHWEDVGEDAASVRSYFPGGAITIANCQGHKAADKMFQFNVPCSVRIEHFEGSEMGKLVRQNGGTEFKLEVDLNTVNVSGVISAVVQSDSPQCFVRYHALTYQFTGSGDKSDRVFRDIPAGNVTQY